MKYMNLYNRRDHVVIAVLFLILVAAAASTFFEIYRIIYFKTVSYDDYARYLLYLLNEPDGKVPPSPFVYRIGSVALASPFYYLPHVVLKGGRAGSELIPYSTEYARALQALCAANVFYVFLSAIIVSAYTRIRLHLSLEWSFVAAASVMIFGNYLALGSVDGIAMFPLAIVILCAAERRLPLFLAAIVCGAIINEKIVLTALLMVGLRMASNAEHRWQYFKLTAVAACALAAFVTVVFAVPFDGGANQKDPSTYISSAMLMAGDLFGAKGIYLNIWPPLLLSVLWAVGLLAPSKQRFVEISDFGIILGLVAISLVLGVKYNVGRIVMHSAPLFVIAATQAMASISNRGETAR